MDIAAKRIALFGWMPQKVVAFAAVADINDKYGTTDMQPRRGVYNSLRPGSLLQDSYRIQNFRKI